LTLPLSPSIISSSKNAPVAQWIEHWSSKPGVVGSNPPGRAIFNRRLSGRNNMIYSFSELTELYQSNVSSVTRTEDYFNTDDYRRLEKENENAYERIKPTCNSLIEILQGKTGGEDIALPGIEKRVGFYNCVLKKQSREMLSSDLRDYIDDVIQSSFLLGITSHLYLYDNPSRSEFENVDAPAVMKQLAPRMMNSSGKMRKYNRKLNTIPILIFEHYFDNQITPLLNEQLNLGLLRCVSARNYFTNLFFFGCRFGEMLDNETRM
jgi:hypothetical protein